METSEPDFKKSTLDQKETTSILFLGFTREVAAETQASLVSARITPRCRIISNEHELKGSLAERSWSLLLLGQMQTQSLDFFRASQIIKELNKDIPVILICDQPPNADTHLKLIEEGIQVAFTGGNEKLTVMYIYQALAGLKQRKHWRLCEALLEKAEHRVTSLIDDSRTAICFVRDNRICYANERFHELLGYTDLNHLSGLALEKIVTANHKETLQETIRKVNSGQDRDINVAVDIIRADTTRFHANLTLNSAVYGEQEAIQIDIVQQLSDTEIFNEIDPISGLLNQAGFAKQLDQRLELARKGGHDSFFLYIQIDTFNEITSTSGLVAIDLLLGSMGQLLKGLINDSHTLAHIEDNVFAVILSDPSPDTAKSLAREICLATVNMKLAVGDQPIHTSCSIGITTINESTSRGTEVFEQATTALKQLHDSDKKGNGFNFYKPDQRKPVIGNDEAAVQQVVDAITHNSFKLLFQPIVPLTTEVQLANYEIFLRLITDDNEEVSPTIFMSSIPDDNVLARMDMWVLEECVMLMRQSLDQGKRNRLFVNVTGRTLRNKSLLPWFAEQLRSLRLPADHFVFQISEVDALASPAYYKAFCKALHKLHCLICLKHYGSTSESSYVLGDAKVDFIKLDVSYLKELNRNSMTPKEMAEIIKPLKEKGMQLIAPMVEDTRQMSQLFRMGINMVQGHYLQPPQPEMGYDFFEAADEESE